MVPVVPVVDASVIAATNFGDATEGGANGYMRFTRDGDLSQSLTITYVAGGTADSGDDYPALSDSVAFAPNPATVDEAIVPVDDTIPEYDESVVFTIQIGQNFTIGPQGTATVFIHDNETPVVIVETITDAVEGGNAGIIRFVRLGDLTPALNVNFTLSGTATSGEDYTPIGTQIAIAGGAWSAEIDVAANQDNLFEGTETVITTITGGYDYTLGTTNSTSLPIVDVFALIGGKVWLDSDSDGFQDFTELPVSGVTAELLVNGLVVDSEAIDGLGNYSFVGPTPGVSYQVQFTAPNGYQFTTQYAAAPTEDSDADSSGRTGTITLLSGERRSSIDAGLVGFGPIAKSTNGYILAENRTYTGLDLLANVFDPTGTASLSVTFVQQPSHGSVTSDSSGLAGVYQYNATSSHTGPDSFTYYATDGAHVTDVITVNILAFGDILPLDTYDDYPEVTGALYDGNGGQPSGFSTRQGQIESCWFNASAAGAAIQMSAHVTERITANANQTYNLTLHDLPAVNSISFAGDTNTYSTANGDWLKVLQKGYGTAVWTKVNQDRGASEPVIGTPYKFINRPGIASSAIEALTGSTVDYDTFRWTRDGRTRVKLQDALENIKVITASTPDLGEDMNKQKQAVDGIVRKHCYTVLGYYPKQVGWQDDWVKLRNPWGHNKNTEYTSPYDGTIHNFRRGMEPAWLAQGQAELADGVFYMRFSEFVTIFSSIDYQE